MPRIIDMTPDGEFVVPPSSQPGRNPRARSPWAPTPWATRLGLGAAIVAAMAGALAVAALFLWVASILIPVALVAGLIAYAAFRFQIWRARHSQPR